MTSTAHSDHFRVFSQAKNAQFSGDPLNCRISPIRYYAIYKLEPRKPSGKPDLSVIRSASGTPQRWVYPLSKEMS
jgi:hypothetical protein